MWLAVSWLIHTALHPDNYHRITPLLSKRFSLVDHCLGAMGSSKAAAAETHKMKLATLLIAVLTFLLQVHTIAGRGTGSCSRDVPCPEGYCCNAKSYCGNSASDCGAGCQSGCIREPKNQFGVSDFSPVEHSMGNDKMDSNESLMKETAAHLVTAELFDNVFPNRDDFYTFEAFVAAAKAFPKFGTTGTADAKKRDVAAFFAHVHHETAGLAKVPEGPPDGAHDSIDFCCAGSCLQLNPFAKSFSCAPGKKYFARGPLQLTWNYNYGSASKALGVDILAEPELLSKDATLSFKSALWVWMTSDAEMPSGHDVMAGPWSPSASDVAANRLPGFGASIDILEGHAECGHESPAAAARTQNYLHIAKQINVSAGLYLDCATMLPFN